MTREEFEKARVRKEWTRKVCKFDVDEAVWNAVYHLFKDKGASMGDQIYIMEAIQKVFNVAPPPLLDEVEKV